MMYNTIITVLFFISAVNSATIPTRDVAKDSSTSDGIMVMPIPIAVPNFDLDAEAENIESESSGNSEEVSFVAGDYTRPALPEVEPIIGDFVEREEADNTGEVHISVLPALPEILPEDFIESESSGNSEEVNFVAGDYTRPALPEVEPIIGDFVEREEADNNGEVHISVLPALPEILPEDFIESESSGNSEEVGFVAGDYTRPALPEVEPIIGDFVEREESDSTGEVHISVLPALPELVPEDLIACGSVENSEEVSFVAGDYTRPALPEVESIIGDSVEREEADNNGEVHISVLPALPGLVPEDFIETESSGNSDEVSFVAGDYTRPALPEVEPIIGDFVEREEADNNGEVHISVLPALPGLVPEDFFETESSGNSEEASFMAGDYTRPALPEVESIIGDFVEREEADNNGEVHISVLPALPGLVPEDFIESECSGNSEEVSFVAGDYTRPALPEVEPIIGDFVEREEADNTGEVHISILPALPELVPEDFVECESVGNSEEVSFVAGDYTRPALPEAESIIGDFVEREEADNTGEIHISVLPALPELVPEDFIDVESSGNSDEVSFVAGDYTRPALPEVEPIIGDFVEREETDNTGEVHISVLPALPELVPEDFIESESLENFVAGDYTRPALPEVEPVIGDFVEREEAEESIETEDIGELGVVVGDLVRPLLPEFELIPQDFMNREDSESSEI